MLNTFKHVKIEGIRVVVPEKTIDIEDELNFFNNDVKLLKRNQKLMGFHTRHVVDESISNTDLLEAAARTLISDLGIEKEKIESLIVTSTSHDYHYPATSCVIHGRLDLNEDCICQDLSGLACSAYVHALMTAHAMISSGAVRNCLVLAGDTASTHSDRRNRNVNMLFGDAGSATWLTCSDESRRAWFYTGTRGKGWDKIVAPAGGSALPVRRDIVDLEVTDDVGNVWHLWDNLMKGMDVFQFSTEVAPLGVKKILETTGKSVDDIDYFAFHQANSMIVSQVARMIGIPKEKFSCEAFEKYANCASCAVVTDMVLRLLKGPVKECCLSTFGVGLSVGCSLLDLSGVNVAPFCNYRPVREKGTRSEQIDYWISYFKDRS